jgi:sugar/nucleoside kinase (ribokinase family)
MALLSGASMFRNGSIIVKLCTKIGDDFIGRQLIDEMEKCGVDLSSPLFKVGEIGSTTGLTNIIVSETEHTRTCIHTPGTCGELTPHDIHEVNLDEVFRNVIHFHTDGRHTEASLLLAKEAKRRRITVSIDVEKDRNSKALDCLLEVADLVFTNSNQIEAYLFRLTRQFEQEVGLERLKEANIIAPGSSSMTDLDMDLYAQIIKPSAYFTRRYGQEGKLIVITKGGHGACSILSTKITESVLTDEQGAISNQIEISKDDVAVVRVLETITERFSHSSNLRRRSTSYDVSTAGVLTDVKVVDTTGT